MLVRIISNVNNKLKSYFALVIECFLENYMMLNVGKWNQICLSKTQKMTNNHIYANSKEETILGTKIDNKLSLYSHIEGLWKKTFQKPLFYPGLCLTKITISESIIKSKFSYCHIIWMLCSRTCNSVINKIN